MLYITFNDAPSGIYFSQVTDVCQFIKKEYAVKVNLVAFISIRSFLSNRSRLKAEFPAAIVIPMFPKLRFWRFNAATLFLICLFIPCQKIIARGPYATWLALKLKQSGLSRKVCFDARGAYTAELNEYEVTNNKKLQHEIHELEETVLLKSDFRLAVSRQLVSYWEHEFSYKSGDHVIIPCTLNDYFVRSLPPAPELALIRKSLGYTATDCVLVYSGSNAGWQSFSKVYDFLCGLLTDNPSVKLLFLSRELPEEIQKDIRFKNRVSQRWVSPQEVPGILLGCDYGLIIREASVTNKVASPVKFAEYLACGLKILISEQIGDYTEFVDRESCGTVIKNTQSPMLSVPSYMDKLRCNELAVNHFSKQANRAEFKKLLQ